MSGLTHTIHSKRDGDTITVMVFGIPDRHTKKQLRLAEEAAYSLLYTEEIKAMSQRTRHYEVALTGKRPGAFTFTVTEVAS
jgi:hypothetical protein